MCWVTAKFYCIIWSPKLQLGRCTICTSYSTFVVKVVTVLRILPLRGAFTLLHYLHLCSAQTVDFRSELRLTHWISRWSVFCTDIYTVWAYCRDKCTANHRVWAQIDCDSITKITDDAPAAFRMSYLYTFLLDRVCCSILIWERIVRNDSIMAIYCRLAICITLYDLSTQFLLCTYVLLHYRTYSIKLEYKDSLYNRKNSGKVEIVLEEGHWRAN